MKRDKKSTFLLLLFVITSVVTVGRGIYPASSRNDIIMTSSISSDWYDSRWHYRVVAGFDAGDYIRKDYPIDTVMNFSEYVDNDDIIDENSIRVISNGFEIPSEYHIITNQTGNVIFVMNGTIGINESRNVTIYFDVERNGFKPVPDYGDPDYIDDYEKYYDLGSSPDNGSLSSWFYPSYLNYSDYEETSKVIGDVKGIITSWGDGWNGTDWIRHYSETTVYRDSFAGYVKIWNNASDDEVVWGSSLLNISTGRPYGVNEDSKDGGLHVITDDWIVENISALDFSSADVLANASIDIYNPVFETTFEFDYIADVFEYYVLPQTDSVVSYLKTVGETSGDLTAQCNIVYDFGTGMYKFVDFIGNLFDDGEKVTVTYTRKTYDFLDELRVVPKNTSTHYLIFYDSTDRNKSEYEHPEVSALIFPELCAATDMVIEFWENRTLRAPGDAFFDYFVNVSANYHEWWYNTSLLPEENHEPQCNYFNMIVAYINDTIDPEQDVNELIESYNNPASFSLLELQYPEPIDITIHSPKPYEAFSSVDMFGISLPDHVLINASSTGDTLYTLYYSLSDHGETIEFGGIVNVSVADIPVDFIGNARIWIVAQDTNGRNVTEYVPIKVSNNYFQALFAVGENSLIFVLLSGLFILIFAWLGIANIRKRNMDTVNAPVK